MIKPGKFGRRALIRSLGLASSALAFGNIRNVLAAPKLVQGDNWYQGAIVHILPTASHERLLIKISFSRPVSEPILSVNTRTVPGLQSDTRGYFWQFHVPDLEASTKYTLQLKDRDGQSMCDQWPLSTLPHPDDDVANLRILAYTCAGGDESMVKADGVSLYLPVDDRRRLLHRGLSLQPDVVIANGDHVYYDQRTMLANKPAEIIDTHQALFDELGMLDRDKPMLGTDNEIVIKNVGDRQIAQLYGVSLRSTPVFMLTDDHDLFENDEATEELISLPPDNTMLEAAQAIQRLYYPEFLPERTRPLNLPGTADSGSVMGLSEVFGTLRYGKLFEALFYDTKRYVNIDNDSAWMVPPVVENWLTQRTTKRETLHLVHIPSTPMAWSAGKWGEWYPDVLGKDGKLTVDPVKPWWPGGWWRQHQRLLGAIGAQRDRIPLIMSGDLHMFSAGKILASGELDFNNHPVYSLVVGPLGSGTPTFPSTARGTLAQVPVNMSVEEMLTPLEKNGFSIINVEKKDITVDMYAWRPPEAVSKIDTLTPVTRISLNR